MGNTETRLSATRSGSVLNRPPEGTGPSSGQDNRPGAGSHPVRRLHGCNQWIILQLSREKRQAVLLRSPGGFGTMPRNGS
jgi:hypothetical protein